MATGFRWIAIALLHVIGVICCIGILGRLRIADAETQLLDPQSPEAAKAMHLRKLEIAKELETLSDHDWAGKYSSGDGLATNLGLTLTPKAGATYHYSGCFGLRGQNHGKVVEEQDRIR